ncbi:MAG: GntR family transcriptional regulator [Peptococcaceae bacterium]|jgi:DNA-binding GntR family transcriptional regulator|nr:GntR family transcriptional regulator [Peptococcaceae bacterium]
MAEQAARPRLSVDFNSEKPLGEVVYEVLRTAIVKNHFKPGDRLMETELADEMAVSRTPVREAVRKLKAESYVVMTPRKGTYVAALSSQDVDDVFEIRAALEAMAAFQAARRASEDEIRGIRDCLEAEAVIWEGSDLEKTVEADIQFHSLLYRASRNKRVEDLINDLREQTHRLRSSTLSTPGRLRFALEEHRKIIDAIAAREPEAAWRAAQTHIERSREVMLGLLRYQT